MTQRLDPSRGDHRGAAQRDGWGWMPAAEAADDLDYGRRRRWAAVWLGCLGVLLVLTVPLAVSLGPSGMSPSLVAQILGSRVLGRPPAGGWSDAQAAIVWQVRAPRVLLGAVVGAGLAIAGVALQALVRNVLADPYLLGVSSGASTGAAAVILFGLGGGAGLGAATLSVAAFAGALLATGALFLIARTGGRVTAVRLLLAGVTVGYLLYAATSFLIFASGDPEGTRSVLFWLLGSLALAGWLLLTIVAAAVALTLVVLLLWARRLDVLAIGDDTALTLGVAPARARVQVLSLVALCVGAVVAVSGSIGFVGLVVPHVARRFVGGAHRLVLPTAALIGAIFLVWADVAARLVLAPQELPIGIVTAVVGAPFLLALIRRFHALAAE